jgi:ABC-type xylose transport system permease subunit
MFVLLCAGMIVVLLGATVLIAAVYSIHEPDVRLRAAFWLVLGAGGAVGVWCTFWLQYQPSPTMRITGFPFSIETLALSNGQWVPYPAPSAVVVDLIVVPSALTLPMSLVMIVRGDRRRKAERRRGFAVVESR